MPLRPFAGALLAALVLPVPALASAWDPSFPAPAVASYLPVEAGTIVVGAGAPSTELAEAEAALAAALRASGKARLVMDDAALGDVSTLDDAAIVARAKVAPTPRIAVVRVFPGADGAPPVAVVTFYDREGKAGAAFSVERGAALAAGAADAPGQGASAAAAQAVAEVGEVVAQTRAEAQERFDREFLWFQDWTAIHVSKFGASTTTGSTPYRGKYKENVEGPRFYEIVGRTDLAEEYRSADHLKTGLILGGGAAVLGGCALMLAPLFTDDCADYGSPGYESCRAKRNNLLWVGTGVALAGSIGMGVGIRMDPNPVDLVQARRLADEYNQGLKKRLGLAAKEEEPAANLRAGLAALPGGGAGLSISGPLP